MEVLGSPQFVFVSDSPNDTMEIPLCRLKRRSGLSRFLVLFKNNKDNCTAPSNVNKPNCHVVSEPQEANDLFSNFTEQSARPRYSLACADNLLNSPNIIFSNDAFF